MPVDGVSHEQSMSQTSGLPDKDATSNDIQRVNYFTSEFEAMLVRRSRKVLVAFWGHATLSPGAL